MPSPIELRKHFMYFRDSIDSLRLPGENKVLKVRDWIPKNTSDPRPHMSHLPFSFKDHEWQIDCLNDMSTRQCVQKPSQIGISEMYVRKAYALCGLHGLNVCYVMPTGQLIRSYVPSRFDPVIDNSIKLSRLVGKPNNNEHKKFRSGANLFIRHSGSEAAKIAISLHVVLMDELDRCSSESADYWKQRLGHASGGGILEAFSTPTYSEIGINAMFNRSDQKYYMIKCEACNEWQIMTFPDSIKFKKGLVGLPEFYMEMPERTGVDKLDWLEKYLEREPYIGCTKCDKRLNRSNVKLKDWVAKFPTRSRSGRQLTRFDVPYDASEKMGHNAATILNSFFDLDGLKEFYNQVLGEPYTTSQDSMSVDDIRNAAAPIDSGFLKMLDKSSAVSYMGIDQGKKIHITIYRRTGNCFDMIFTKEISMVGNDKNEFRLMEVLDEIGELKRRFNVRFIACDAQPDFSLPRALAVKYTKQVVWVYFADKCDGFTEPTETNRTVSVNRTWLLNQVSSMVKRDHDSMILRFPAHMFDQGTDKMGLEIIRHFTAMVKTDIEKENREKSMVEIKTVWQLKTGRRSDLFLSSCYALLAYYLYRKVFMDSPYTISSLDWRVVRNARLV